MAFYTAEICGRTFEIPDCMEEGIKLYLERGIQPGDFLTAIICNDLKTAVMQADHNNILNLPAYVAYFYWEVPAVAWGSKKIMQQWMKERREEETDD